MKIIRAILTSVLFAVVLIAACGIHVTHFRVDVVFYAAIADGIIASAIAGMLLSTIGWFRVLSGFEKLELIVNWLISGYAIDNSVSGVIDRSLSDILEKRRQRAMGKYADDLTHPFRNSTATPNCVCKYGQT